MKNIKTINQDFETNHLNKFNRIKNSLAQELEKVANLDQDLTFCYGQVGNYDYFFKQESENLWQWKLECSQFKLYCLDGDDHLKALKVKTYDNLIKLHQQSGLQISYYSDKWVIKWDQEEESSGGLNPYRISFCLELWKDQLAKLDGQQILAISQFINKCNHLFIDQKQWRILNWKYFKPTIKEIFADSEIVVGNTLGLVFSYYPQNDCYQGKLQYYYEYDHQLVDEKVGDFDYKISDEAINLNDLVVVNSPLGQFLNDANFLSELKRFANPVSKKAGLKIK